MNLVGFVQALLLNIATIAGMNDPQLKVTPKHGIIEEDQAF